ncbi:MAG: serine/threonine protein kinase [Gemmataceae bacterium]|nr:serine/threonine protein kinase [Gemmataceae bacterium]MCI0738836.1 serine/threonine protein kinase [Gemmataceae bacterium]
MLAPHQRLDDFEIIRLLGRGGMGEVYEAEQASLRRRVALKVLKPWLSQNPDALRRFLREARVPAELEHPGIVRIITTGATKDGYAYYAMQLVRGVSLAQLVRLTHEPSATPTAVLTGKAKTPSLSDKEVSTPADRNGSETFEDELPGLARAYFQDRFRTLAKIGAQAARALAFAHAQGHLHRDIKPSNLMVDFHDQVYLVDFGLTRALEPDAMSTAVGAVAGTPWYMSPEQAQGQVLDERSDLFSLGVTLFELATNGVGPYTVPRSNRAAVLAQIVAGQRLPLRTLAPDISETLEAVILKALHDRPERRHSNGLELAADLEAFAAGGTAQRKSWLSPQTKRRSKKLLVYSFAATLLVMGGWMLGGGFFQRDTSGNAEQTAKEENPLPPMLVHRPWRTWLNLISEPPAAPVWAKRVWGDGAWAPAGEKLLLRSLNGLTMFALDDDPHKRWFEWSMDFDAITGKDSNQHQMGYFFGLRQDLQDPQNVPGFFMAMLDERPDKGYPNGKWTIGVSQFSKGFQDLPVTSWLQALPAHWSKPLSLVGPPTWHNVRVRALDDKITITLNNATTPADPNELAIDLKQLRSTHTTYRKLDARGAWGVWVKNGTGQIRNAKILALAPLDSVP